MQFAEALTIHERQIAGFHDGYKQSHAHHFLHLFFKYIKSWGVLDWNDSNERDDSGSDINRKGDSERDSDNDGFATQSKNHASNEMDNLTLFVRNIPVLAKMSYTALRPLGALYYAKIVLDKKTNRSMGTAFVLESSRLWLQRSSPSTAVYRWT